MIYIENKKKSMNTLQKNYPDAIIIDVTSKGEEPWVKVSPFYPHGEIPIPFSPGYFAVSVEGIWQGLKVFEMDGIDISKFNINNMVGIKRTVRKYGKPLGHRSGVNGTELFDYLTARYKIYLPAYAWMLDNKAQETIQLLRKEAENHDLVLLDFDTNGDLDNIKKPLSHAALVKRYLEKKYPELATIKFEPKVPILDVKKAITKKKVEKKNTKSKSKNVDNSAKVSKPKKVAKKKVADNPSQLSLPLN